MSLGKKTGGRKPGVKKTGGRKAGTSNRVSTDMKKAILSLFDDNWPQIQKDLRKLTEVDRLAFFAKLMPYVVPKMASVDHTTNGKDMGAPPLVWIDADSLTPEQINEVIKGQEKDANQ